MELREAAEKAEGRALLHTLYQYRAWRRAVVEPYTISVPSVPGVAQGRRSTIPYRSTGHGIASA
eukprot:107613-Rhodomonas_salina.1